jgi:hypothetical protein
MSTAPVSESQVVAAFEYAYPLYTMAQTRWNAVQDAANPVRHGPNTLQHDRQLADHRSRWLTAPNNDTLYSNAWLDLSQGPVRVAVGAMPAGRYWSVAFMDAFTNHIAMLGQRVDGTGPVEVTLLGPAHHGLSVEGRSIRAPGDHVWLFARCLVDGPDDLPQACAMQAQITVQATAGAVEFPLQPRPTASTDARNFLAVVNAALVPNPPPAAERALLASWAAIGIRPSATDGWDALDAPVRAAWTRHIAKAHAELRASSRKGRRDVQGWHASALEMGNFGSHYRLRASVALGGLGALEPAEAMYFVRFHDDALQQLDGSQRYLLRLPPGGIPTDAFWSFSMYVPTADGQRFFTPNPIDRYSIGNRTRGLRLHADGSLDIALQADAPTDPVLRANWLPTPATGAFQVSLRAYLPTPALRAGQAQMPKIVRA